MADPRAIAASILKEVLRGKASLATLIPNKCKHLQTQDSALVRELCFGTCRFEPLLSACIKQLLDKPLRNKDYDIYALLLLGCYQLSYLRTPDHAAISATVGACQTLKKGWAKKLVNGVLRQYQRKSDLLTQQLQWWQVDAHPQWLAEQIKAAWPEHYQQILDANNQYPPFCLRVNSRFHSREDYIKLLPAELKNSTCHFASDGIYLEKAVDVTSLPGFDLGWLSVQDEAAQLAAAILNPAGGEKILDACAAPGGKTCHLLERQKDCNLTALDNDLQRCEKIDENLKRLQLKAKVVCADAINTEQWWDGTAYDAILLDAPCSASGVIRRHPDIKQLRKADDIGKLAHQQRQLLDALWPTLKEGGRLLYATCSVLPVENELLIAEFLQQTADAQVLSIPIEFDQQNNSDQAAHWGKSQNFGKQLFPNNNGHDGFYYSYLLKTAKNDQAKIRQD